MKKIVVILAALCLFFGASRATFCDTATDQALNINDQIVAKKQQIGDLNKQISASQDTISALQNSEDTLQNEIAILNNQVAQNNLDIQSTQDQIDEITLELQNLDAQISDMDKHVTADKDMLADLIRKIDREDDSSAMLSTFLSDDLSSIFARVKSMTDLQGDMLATVKRLQEEKAAALSKRAERLAKSNDLRTQKDQLEVDQIRLTDTLANKQELMDETRNSENKYQGLVSSLRSEADTVTSDITSLEDQVKQRIAADDRFPTGDVILSWPVNSHTITTTFHDPNYPFRRIMEHPGIDIGDTPQGTPVHAAAPGYILKVHDGGYGYSYVIILHADGISTVYGHLSRITATEETYVDRDDVIGYSGGMPGTRGAGPMTTGPHLHFEVRVSGIPTDPMDYLVQ
jgi:murein DD-endopeptidase MepM/ murein hydrolase activator NlpD